MLEIFDFNKYLKILVDIILFKNCLFYDFKIYSFYFLYVISLNRCEVNV